MFEAFYLDEIVGQGNRLLMSNTYTEGECPKAYLAKRGLDMSDIEKYKLGYFQNNPILRVRPNLQDFKDLCTDTYSFGIVRGKLMIPVSNLLGNFIGATVRAMPWNMEGKARYKQIFNKEAKEAGAIFGLEQAITSIIQDNTVYVTEGSFDAMSLAKVLPNAVSTLTSALTENQAVTLSGLADNLVLVFDDDTPGELGAQATMEKYSSLFKTVSSRTSKYSDCSNALERMGLEDFSEMVNQRIKLRSFR